MIVDDSTSIDQEIFNMEAYEGSDWVRISDDLPVDENGLEQTLEEFQTHYHGGTAGLGLGHRARAGRRDRRRGRGGRAPGPRTGGLMADYSVAKREEATDWMADYPGFGEMRWYSDALGTEQVSFSWRTMPPGTGGRGSYGHRHPGQEEVYFVIGGRVTFKIDDDVFEAGPQTAVRIGADAFRSVHNDTDQEAELLILSTRDPDAGTEQIEDFWPE